MPETASRNAASMSAVAFAGRCPGRGGQQDHPEGGGGGDRVHDLEVPDLLVSPPAMARPHGEGGHDLDPRGGQPEHAVEGRQVLADIGGPVARDWDRDDGRHGLATAVDPPSSNGWIPYVSSICCGE